MDAKRGSTTPRSTPTAPRPANATIAGYASAARTDALVAAAETLAPDVIVTDIAMPGLNGIAAAAEILRRNSAARIVFVTVHNDPELVKKGLATGALGYVLKLTAGDDLVPAIHAVLRGEQHLSPSVVGASD